MIAPLLFLLTATPRAEIQRAYDAWGAAYVAKDLAGLDALISPDFVAISPNGHKRDRVDFLGAIMKNYASTSGPKLTKFVVTIDKLEKAGSGYMATITERWTFGDKVLGQVTADGWAKNERGWQVTSTRFIRRLGAKK